MGTASDLVGFLKEQKEQEGREGFDRDGREWMTDVLNLIRQIEGWLSEPAKQQLVNLEEFGFAAHEEPLGEQHLTGLKIHAPKGRLIIVQPVARFVIGGEGRVDLLSGPRRVSLLRTKERTWLVARSEPNQVAYHVEPLDEALFSEILKDLLA